MKLRTTLKIATATSIILLCLGIAISLYFKMSATERVEEFDLYTLVPPHSRMVVDTENMVNLVQGINELSCSKDNRFLYFSRFFGHLKDHINTLLEYAPHGLSKQMNKMLISFHEPDSVLDQVFYFRLGAGDYKFMEQFINEYFSNSFPARSFEYRGEVIRIYPLPDDMFLVCYVTDEFLVVSYQKKLIEEVIDARLTKNSILSDEQFGKIRAGHRMLNPATIYTRMGPIEMGRDGDMLRFRFDLGHWTEFNVNLNGDAIYLSGINYDVDSCATFFNTLRTLKPVANFPGELLPDSLLFFSVSSISDLSGLLAFTTRNTYTQAPSYNIRTRADDAVHQLLKVYAGDHLITCMFHPEDAEAEAPHLVMNMPLRNDLGIEQALAGLRRYVSQDRNPEQLPAAISFSTIDDYTAYLLPRNTLFTQLTGVADPSLPTYACVYKDRLLISPAVETLHAYIEIMEGKGSFLEENSFYSDMTSTLSETYNYMMMADMEQVFRQPSSYVRFVPNLFFRYSNFFRHFMITTQFTSVDDVLYPNLILTYKN